MRHGARALILAALRRRQATWVTHCTAPHMHAKHIQSNLMKQSLKTTLLHSFLHKKTAIIQCMLERASLRAMENGIYT